MPAGIGKGIADKDFRNIQAAAIAHYHQRVPVIAVIRHRFRAVVMLVL